MLALAINCVAGVKTKSKFNPYRQGGMALLALSLFSLWPARAKGQARQAWIGQPVIAPGYCPRSAAVVRFNGWVRITMPTPAAGQPRPTQYAISYYFLRSDGSQSATQTRFFTTTGAAQTFQASDIWTLQPGTNGWWPPRTGWEEVAVLLPPGQPPVRSRPAGFRLSCPPGGARPWPRHNSGSRRPVGAQTASAHVRPAWLKASIPAGFCRAPHFPVVVNFQGAIPAPARQPATVSYRFLRSDGGRGPWQFVRFLFHTNQQPVRFTWTLWRKYRGWVEIEMRAPLPGQPLIRSAPASFDLSCDHGLKEK